MNTSLKKIGSVAITLIAGCASYGSTEPAMANSWMHQCYPAFHQDVDFLAGSTAVDCGFLQLDTPESTKQKIVNCATQASKSNKAFKFGYKGAGDDSWFCEAAIRAPGGQLYSLYFDSDVTGQGAARPENARLWLSRCNSIEMHQGTISPNSFFAMSGCSESQQDSAELTKARDRKH